MRNKICSLPGLIKESLATSVYTLKMKKRRAFVVMSILCISAVLDGQSMAHIVNYVIATMSCTKPPNWRSATLVLYQVVSRLSHGFMT